MRWVERRVGQECPLTRRLTPLLWNTGSIMLLSLQAAQQGNNMLDTIAWRDRRNRKPEAYDQLICVSVPVLFMLV